jgi:hypothetical protein
MQRPVWLLALALFPGLAPAAQGETPPPAAPAQIIAPAAELQILAYAADRQTIGIDLRVRGAVDAQVAVKRPVDGANFCSAAADPWSADQTLDIRPAPFPFYRVVFGQPGPGAPLDRPGPSLGITLSRWLPPDRPGWAEEHQETANDTFDLVIEERHFVGHGGLSNPVPRMLFAWRDDGRGGGFLVTGLHEVGGDGVLDVEGTWSCPPIDESLPEVSVVPRRSPPDAVPATAAPPVLPFRLRRIGDAWWVTAPDGQARLVAPDLGRLRLAEPLRAGAERGQLVLLVQGELREGDPLRLVARHLQGVMPAPPEGVAQR